MKTDRYFLIDALTTYADAVMRKSFYWRSLDTNVFITDISEFKVRIEFIFLQSKTKCLKSCRRSGINKFIERLDKQLDIKKQYKINTQFKEVQNTKDWKGENIEYSTCFVEYLIPKELYNQLEVLAKVDRESIIELSKVDEILIRNTVA